ncbi:MAG: aminotransferase class I/II-fold pyridoxal phosphate-dependent enzyme [Planctomycetaceae bacterium]|jgi:aspartate aminotransferase/aminotransferase|nr:aminotransferase class I/II-fold pyridoxal phosphate-dependent enzyme [Planctomycetaceae bacterium]
MIKNWFSDRAFAFSASGIRKVFDLGAKLENPINLSIGQPDFDMPDAAKNAAIEAVRLGKNGYSPTQGIAPLLQRLQKEVDAEYTHPDRSVFLTSGTSGGLVLTLLATVNPGDEVIMCDPYFVMYEAVTKMIGGVPVPVDTYPDFKFPVQKFRDAVTPKTKLILFNSPSNPSGSTASPAEAEAVARLAAEKNLLLVSDEIYSMFCHSEFVSPAKFNPQTLVLGGYSKSYGMPGWRVGFAHGPKELIEQLLKFQQYTFVCAPQPGQWGALAALDCDMSREIAAYRRKRDRLYDGIKDYYEVVKPEGAFYMFPKAPWGTASEFVNAAVTEHSLLIIPGNIFSRYDTHFRISYAASEETIERGIKAFRKLAVKKK